MNSSYWDSRYRELMANKPKAPSSFFNKSFTDRLADAEQNISNLVSEQDKASSYQQQKMDDYNAFQGSMRSYGDVYKENENEFDAKGAFDDYEKSKKALAMTNSMLESLPSSINANSNVVLTQSQKEARYNALSSGWQRYNQQTQKQVSTYEDAWKNARAEQQAKTSLQISQQNKQLDDYGSAWTKAMNQYNEMVKRTQNAKLEKLSIQNQYHKWQGNQANMALYEWANRLNSALDRYVETLNTEMTQRELESQNRIADINARINQTRQDYANMIVDARYAIQKAKSNRLERQLNLSPMANFYH